MLVQLRQEIAAREAADAAFAANSQLVVAGALADTTEGPGGALYEGLGHTRKSTRKTGLTRRKRVAPPDK